MTDTDQRADSGCLAGLCINTGAQRHLHSFSLLIPLGNFRLTLSFNLNTVIVLLAAGVTATGMDWLLRTHPSLEKGETREHWLLPTLTVLVTGIALYTLPNTPIWWLGFGLGAAIFRGGGPG